MAEDNLLENIEDLSVLNESPLDKYVGEGKKYKTVEDLAKAYEHAEAHITKMNEDNGHLREEFEMFRDFTTAQLTKQKAINPNPADVDPNEHNREHQPAPITPKADADVDFDALISKKLDEKSEQDRLKSNADMAQEVMIKHYGSKEEAIEAVNARAEELGVSAQWLANTAFHSPRAFFATMGVDPETVRRSTNSPASSSDVNLQRLQDANPGTKPGTYDFYQKLRRESPAKFYSYEVQKEYLENALRLGPDFYNR